MDTLAAVSLATEPPSNNPEKWGLEEVRKKDQRIINASMWRNIVVQVAYQLLVLVVMLYSVPYWFGIGYNYVNTDLFKFGDVDSDNMRKHYTIMFHTFVLMNLFNQLACRKIGWAEFNIMSDFFNNIWFFIVIGAEFAAQWCIVEYLNVIFRTNSLDWVMHITCFSFGIGSILFNLLFKKILESQQEYAKWFEFKFLEDRNENSMANRYLNYLDTSAKNMSRSKTMNLLEKKYDE